MIFTTCCLKKHNSTFFSGQNIYTKLLATNRKWSKRATHQEQRFGQPTRTAIPHDFKMTYPGIDRCTSWIVRSPPNFSINDKIRRDAE